MDELIDVVNEKDEILYSVSKKEAHDKGLLHRTVVAMIRDTGKRFVLVKQASDRQDPGQYVSPVGGHVQASESEEEAIKREALEEMGIADFKFRLLGKAIFNREVFNRKENHYFIYYEIYNDGPYTVNEESVSFKAFTETELKKLIEENPEMFGAAFHFVVQKFFPQLLT